MQTARHLVAVVVELAAGVQDGQHDFGGGLAAGVLIDRNAAAVVDDRDGVVDVDRDVDLVAVAGERLVDRVVDDLVDEMVQPGSAGRADVHRGTLADRLEAFEDLDLVRAVVVRRASAVAVAPDRGRGAVRRSTRVLRRAAADRCFVLRFVRISASVNQDCVTRRIGERATSDELRPPDRSVRPASA